MSEAADDWCKSQQSSSRQSKGKDTSQNPYQSPYQRLGGSSYHNQQQRQDQDQDVGRTPEKAYMHTPPHLRYPKHRPQASRISSTTTQPGTDVLDIMPEPMLRHSTTGRTLPPQPSYRSQHKSLTTLATPASNPADQDSAHNGQGTKNLYMELLHQQIAIVRAGAVTRHDQAQQHARPSLLQTLAASSLPVPVSMHQQQQQHSRNRREHALAGASRAQPSLHDTGSVPGLALSRAPRVPPGFEADAARAQAAPYRSGTAESGQTTSFVALDHGPETRLRGGGGSRTLTAAGLKAKVDELATLVHADMVSRYGLHGLYGFQAGQLARRAAEFFAEMYPEKVAALIPSL